MDETFESWWSPDEGFHVVDAMTADALTRSQALPPDEGAWWWMTHGSVRDDDARELQISRLRSGLDLLVVDQRVHADTSKRPAAASAMPLSELAELTAGAQPPMQPALTFLEIVLVDDAGRPIANEAYEVELADGQLRSGSLDEGGFARIDGIPIGPCTVRFPNCHRAEVEAA